MNKHEEKDEFEMTGEEIPDEAELEDIEEEAGDKLKRLREKLGACEKEKAKHLEDLQRLKADFLNSRKRLEEEAKRSAERVTEAHVYELLPLADSFDMAMQSESWNTCDETWRKGVEGIHAKLLSILRGYNAESLGVKGEAFDPQIHDAVANKEVTETEEAGIVMEVLQKGYRIGERIVRPAKVVVGIRNS